MDIQKISDATEVLSWLRKQASDTPEAGDGGAVMAANLALAGAYLAGYAEHIAKGKHPHDALIATARCEFAS
jgi:hypothetical protein